MAPKTWLITGASSGLGTSIAEAALKAGHKVIGTARNPSKAAKDHPQIESLGGTWMELDVDKPDAKQKVEDAIRKAETIDVLVNNAGYSILGSIEDMSEDEIHHQFNTNVYGPVRIIKAALPFMRAQKSGTIVNVGSIAGLDGLPTCAMYSGTKFALEGMSESLARELQPFNIRVLLVEPGAFRTSFLASFRQPAAGMNQAYKGTPLEDGLQYMTNANGKQDGDPIKGSQRIVEVIDGTGMGVGKTHLLRMMIGPDCYSRAEKKVNTLRENLEQMKEIAHSTSY